MEFLAIVVDGLLMVLHIIHWLVLIWVLLSWILFFVRQTQFRWRHRKAYTFLEQLDEIFARMTHPFLRPIRRMLRRFDTAGIDWSPLVLLLLIWLLQRLLGVAAARLILSR
ncbi:MAG TPA: YggT family protein [Thermoanaerobaculia bacterium]|jgi:uncharacterized protein YggT (Ycf19 family)